MESVILAFVLGLCLSTWRVHLAILLRDIYAKLQNLLQSDIGSSETQFVPPPPLMVNQAVQTEHEEHAKGLVKTDPTDSGKDQSHEASPESEELGKELEVIQSDPETLELGDLNDLRDYLYEDNPKAAVSASTIEPALEDSVLKSMTSAVRELFGDQVPPSCVSSSSVDSAYNKTSYAEDDFNNMKKLLRQLTCRYAVSQGNVTLLRSYLFGAENDEYFGLLKLAIDKDHPMAFRALLQRVRLENICSQLPALFEYAALRGSLSMMKELREIEIEIDVHGDDSTHPLSAAVAGGSIDAVKLLLQWGANLNDRDRKSIVKRYTQTPIVIAAHHQHTTMVKYLIGAGQSARSFYAKRDALSIALADGHATMLLCILRSGITFTKVDPPLEKGLEIAVNHRNAELAKLLFEAGANPNAEEQYISRQWVAARYKNYNSTTVYGTLFQWACATNDENMVRVFLEHGVDFGKPVKSWANWHYNTPIYVAWSMKHFKVVHAILDYYEEEALAQFACRLVQNGYWGLFKHCSEYDSVRIRSSWLLKKCLTRLHEVSGKGRFPAKPGKAYASIIRTLIGMGAWLPPDTTWHFSDKLVLWLGYASLDEFLIGCAL